MQAQFFKVRFLKVKDLKPMQTIDTIELEIVSKEEPRQFATERGSGTVCSCAAKDSSGEVKLTLWNEQCNEINEGDKITLTEGWCSLYKGQLQISTGKKGKIEKKE